MLQNKTIKILITATLLTSSSLLASESFVDSVGLNLGKSYMNYDQKSNIGTTVLEDKLERAFDSIELYTTLSPILEIGKVYDIKPYISYTYSQNSELKHQYLLVGLNKYYTPLIEALELYAGVVGGYGQASWKYDPLGSSINKKEDMNSFMGGVQLGASYKITKKLSLGVHGKYIFHSYETSLKTNDASAVLEHDSTLFVGLGVEWRFGTSL